MGFFCVDRLAIAAAHCGLLLVALSACGCDKPNTPDTSQSTLKRTPGAAAVRTPASPQATTSPSPVQFVDVTARSGITFRHNSGSFGAKWAPETMGSGVAVFDFNGDGRPDIFFVNGRNWTAQEVAQYQNGNGKRHRQEHFFKLPPNKTYRRSAGALYRNNGDGTFTDATSNSGLDVEIYGMGATAGDYDNDGRVDLFVTSLERNYLFQNQGAGRFRDVSDAAGVQRAHWSTSATWIDYDRDGRLDLFVCQYTRWTPATDSYHPHQGQKSISGPELYAGQFSRLFRNLGSGRFADVSVRAGIHKSGGRSLVGKALGVTICDYNNDLWPDIVVANDRKRNFLFRNNQKGAFIEEGEKAGIAYGAMGRERAGMGIDMGDVDHSNRESLLITNFSNEMLGLYLNNGRGQFTDVAPTSEVGRASFPYLGFGCTFVDVDNDTWLDILVANGHVNDLEPKRARQPILLFHNRTALAKALSNLARSQVQPSFVEVGAHSGSALREPVMGRGLAHLDFDLDGDSDLVVTSNNGPARLLRNVGGQKLNSIRVVLRGTKSNRDAIGAVVWGEIGSELLRRRVRSGSSYLSQSELPLTLGLGQSREAKVVVRWPSGKLMTLGQVEANQIITVVEEKGIVKKQPLVQETKPIESS